ncbi:hypothetical protein BDV95DRAFT_629036 [Massariosphaeria phaeospora]|uniref:DUF8021 domain-containing protein n=1 Tax=Massariosphaeria phaeospora TaxID=100035 RepID=A0A7C8I905_9PLEO|nr:hypothetical protein BDV95DRAFT_629036 [Massariosphaeria phaeospora]
MTHCSFEERPVTSYAQDRASLFLSFAATVSADCTRSFLKAATGDYLAAWLDGNPAGVTAFAAQNLKYMENNIPLNVSTGTLSVPIKFDYNFSAHDTVRCAIITEIVAATDPHPYVIHTRMVFGKNDGKAELIESISWSVIPKDKQDTRAVVQAAGDAYFDRFGNTFVTVPWGPPCYRVEGGLSAAGILHNDTQFCEMEWPSTIIFPYRRYVGAEELGVVGMFIGFPGLDRTQGQSPMPDSHLFRVEGGKIKYSHTASSCVTAGCGLNETFGGGFEKRSVPVAPVRLRGIKPGKME